MSGPREPNARHSFPLPVRHISTAIDRPASEVYAFVSNPKNLPAWASGLGREMTQVDDVWIADSPMGSVRVRFTEANPHGILDHEVTLPNGTTFSNPLRVFANGDGCEIVFTLFRHPGVEDAAYDADAATIARDLAALKALLE